jgi:hypothetical protein
MSCLDDDIFQPNVIVVAIFGNTNKVSEQDIQDNTLIPILRELGRPPDKVLIPTEGNSSIYIQDWAEALHIKSQTFHSDWIKNGRIAQIIRDDRMAKECTHALVFLSQKSTRLEKMAEKMCKKGKVVFTLSHDQILTELELSKPKELTSKPKQKASKPVHILDKGKEHLLWKDQTKAKH